MEDSHHGNKLERGKSMNKCSLILYILGVLMLLYFVVCFDYAGLSTSFTMAWGIGGAVCILVAVILHKMWMRGFVWPTWSKVIVGTVLAIGIVVFACAESMILYYGNQTAPEKVEYLVVLGARVNGTKLTGSLWRRLNAAVDYLEQDANKDTVVSV